MKIKLSKSQWENIGKVAGWTPRDPTEFSDQDIGPFYDADEEENALLGEEEDYDPDYAYNSGYDQGIASLKYKHLNEGDNPYRVDTEEGVKKFDEWRQGFKDAVTGLPKDSPYSKEI